MVGRLLGMLACVLFTLETGLTELSPCTVHEPARIFSHQQGVQHGPSSKQKTQSV